MNQELVDMVCDAMWKALKAAQDDAPMGGAYVNQEEGMIDASGAGISLEPAAKAAIEAMGAHLYEVVMKHKYGTVNGKDLAAGVKLIKDNDV